MASKMGICSQIVSPNCIETVDVIIFFSPTFGDVVKVAVYRTLWVCAYHFDAVHKNMRMGRATAAYGD